MKQTTCAQMGGSCDAIIMGNTDSEWAQNGMKHIMDVHPEMAKDIQSMSTEELTTWNTQNTLNFNAAPEM